jgi:hypothetical protein
MGEYLIDFDKINWERAYIGQRQKVYEEGNHRIRLVELSDDYAEEDWCIQEHLGYILKGRMSVVFSDGKSMTFNEGNGMFIPLGEEHKHKGRMASGEIVQIIFVEKV